MYDFLSRNRFSFQFLNVFLKMYFLNYCCGFFCYLGCLWNDVLLCLYSRFIQFFSMFYFRYVLSLILLVSSRVSIVHLFLLFLEVILRSCVAFLVLVNFFNEFCIFLARLWLYGDFLDMIWGFPNFFWTFFFNFFCKRLLVFPP